MKKLMNVQLGKTEVSMLNPPNEGTVEDPSEIYCVWKIARNGQGNIVLRFDGSCHPDFLDGGMDLQSFCQWINSRL